MPRAVNELLNQNAFETFRASRVRRAERQPGQLPFPGLIVFQRCTTLDGYLYLRLKGISTKPPIQNFLSVFEPSKTVRDWKPSRSPCQGVR